MVDWLQQGFQIFHSSSALAFCSVTLQPFLEETPFSPFLEAGLNLSFALANRTQKKWQCASSEPGPCGLGPLTVWAAYVRLLEDGRPHGASWVLPLEGFLDLPSSQLTGDAWARSSEVSWTPHRAPESPSQPTDLGAKYFYVCHWHFWWVLVTQCCCGNRQLIQPVMIYFV